MIRILHIVTYMGCGGLETMLMNYYRHMDREKIQFDFLVHREFESYYDKEIQELGGRIYRLPRLNPFDRVYLSKLNNFFMEYKEYRIVHCHLDCMAGIPLKYAKKNGVPIRIAHAHSNNQTKDIKYLLKLLFKQNIKKYATDLFACSYSAGKWMFNTSEVTVVRNGIDSDQYKYNEEKRNAIRKELGIEEDTVVIGHVGRFAVPKNHKFILNIFQKISETHANSKLVLVGEGDLMDEIEELSRKLGVFQNVIFTGLRKDVPDLLQAMDVFVFPSLYEGLGIVAIEAQAAGLPCFISDKVPMECCISDLVEQIELNKPVDVWSKRILEKSHIIRRDMTDSIISSGYDIKIDAKKMQEKYLNYHI